MSEMFCFQCQQTAGNSGCVRTGVCGKQPKTANLQDYLVCSLIHLAEIYAAKEDYPPEVTHLLADGLSQAIPILVQLGSQLLPVFCDALALIFQVMQPLIPVIGNLAATLLPPLASILSMLVGALLLCAGCGKSGDIYTAGVYTASAEGYSGPVTVEVEFDGSSILSVHVLSHSETVNISDRAIDELPSRIVEAQTWDVDAVSSATFTSDAIREAVRDCLAQAALR